LLPNKESAEDEEEVDTHPSEASDGENAQREFAEDRQVIEHDDRDCERAEGVETEKSVGGGGDFTDGNRGVQGRPRLLHWIL